MALTIDELVHVSTLGIGIVAGGQGAHNEIRSVQACDLDDPVTWITEGTLLLRTDRGAISEREVGLLSDLRELGMAGLGIGLMGPQDRPHADMIDEADRVGLPLLTVPARTSFQEVATYVFSAIASAEMYRLRRTVSVHDTLLSHFEHDGMDSIMETACSLLDARIFLVGEGGTPDGMWPAELRGTELGQVGEKLWEAYGALTPSIGEGVLESSLGFAHFAEIRCREEWSGVLFCLKSSGSPITELDAGVVTYLKGLLQLYHAGGLMTRQSRREGRADLLQRLAAGEVPAYRVGAALSYHGFAVTDALVAVLLSPRTSSASLASSVLDAKQRREDLMTATLSGATEYLEALATPFLCGLYDGLAAFVLPASMPNGRSAGLSAEVVVRSLQQHLESSEAATRVSVGISAATHSAEEMPVAFSHALQALQRALAGRDADGDVVLYCDLGVEQKVLNALSDDLLAELSAKVIDRLSAADPDDADQLLEVLSTYVSYSGSVAQTANALFMHRNTLRRRIARIEGILGLDFSVYNDIAEVRLGLRASEVVRSRRVESDRQAPLHDVS